MCVCEMYFIALLQVTSQPIFSSCPLGKKSIIQAEKQIKKIVVNRSQYARLCECP